MDNDSKTREQIARLLTGRCNNCYRRLPGDTGCDVVKTPGWNWHTPNFGPFCNHCYAQIARHGEK